MRLKQKMNRVFLVGLASMLASSCSAGDVVQAQSQAPVGGNQSSSLCERNEEVYFSCRTESEKTISICASSPSSPESRVIYRFGGREDIELQHVAGLGSASQSGSSSDQVFLKNRYFRALIDYTEVAFKTGGHEYRVFRRFSDESIDPQGPPTPSREFGVEVNVADTGEALAVIACSRVHVDNLRELSRLLPCDDSNALGCAD